MLKLIKSKQTEWEKLEDKKAERAKDIVTMERLLEVTLEEQRKATVAGKSIPEYRKVIQNCRESLEALQEEINILEQEQAKFELEHFQTKMRKLEQQEQKIREELEPHEKAYEKAKANFEEAEQVWFAKHNEAHGELENINRQKLNLSPRLEQLVPHIEPESKHSVEEWLQLCRDGGVRTYTEGSDPTLDEAYQIYEQEIKDLRNWAKKTATIRQSTGERPPMPEAGKHYSKERLKEVIKKHPGGGSFNEPSRGGVKKASI
jgi:chromosome segregation ATPase